MKNAVMDAFFEKWTLDTIAWFKQMQDEYYAEDRADCEARNGRVTKESMDTYRNRVRLWEQKMGRGNFDMIRHYNMESIGKIVRKDMDSKKAKVYAKVTKKVGDITELDLHRGMDGTPNGRITGTVGTAYITTITAGGYNIQCLHYRVLVK